MMNTSDLDSDQELEATNLRAELKTWETTWASEHGGAKPSRDDIKRNDEISRKYKAYNKIRDSQARVQTEAAARQHHASRAQKRERSENLGAPPPVKRSKFMSTPSKSRPAPPTEPYGTPSSKEWISPAIPTSIGPTPQRNGRVLGLFDLLAGTDAPTPSKAKSDATNTGPTVFATPSKQRPESRAGPELAVVCTPRQFKTPLKDLDNNAVLRTPQSSVSKLQFATPSFLRRAKLPALDENGEMVSPEVRRPPRKIFGRSLSSTVASLRRLEEEALDEELEMLHEMEGGGQAMSRPPVKATEAPYQDTEESGPRLLGGFDDAGEHDSAPEEQVDRDGNPLRVFKKKGQKRTTRRSNMKPVRGKRPTVAEDHGSADEQDYDEAVVPETMLAPLQASHSNPSNQNLEPLSDDSDFAGSDEDYHNKDVRKQKKTKAEKKDKTDKEGRVKKVVRKVNELAHANFKRMKMRNTGAKGGVAHNSRFRRRR